MQSVYNLDKILLVNERVSTVRKIAYRINKSYGFSFDFDELVQWGCLGLVESYASFKEGSGVDFMTYAGHRIRGSILDGIRAMSPLSVSFYNTLKSGGDAQIPVVVPYDDGSDAAAGSNDESADDVFFDQLIGNINDANILEITESFVVKSYFLHDASLREIADSLGVTDVRVSQIKARAIKKLKEYYENQG